MMRTPPFWITNDWRAYALMPLSWIYGAGQKLHAAMTPSHAPVIPTLCVGNAVAGGAGKTPTVLALAQLLKSKHPTIVTRGYGGMIKETVVQPSHTAAEVGDEAVMLARQFPTVVARERLRGVTLAAQHGATLALLDDGLQHYAIAPTASLLVVDGETGFGNARLLPAGPLREPIAAVMRRVQGIVVIHPTTEIMATVVRHNISQLPVFTAKTTVTANLQGPVVAFAGIGYPEKFHRALTQAGVEITAFHAFADHHLYTEHELAAMGAPLVTTRKDWVRLPPAWQTKVTPIDMTLTFDDAPAVMRWLEQHLCAA